MARKGGIGGYFVKECNRTFIESETPANFTNVGKNFLKLFV